MKHLVRLGIFTVVFVAIGRLAAGLFHLDGAGAAMATAGLALLAVAAAVGINVLYNLWYWRSVRALMPLLDSGRGDEYVEQMQRLLRRAKGRGLRRILNLNLSSGLLQEKRYEEALTLLDSMAEETFPQDDMRLGHRMNTCQACFFLGDAERAIRIREENRELFEQFRDDARYGPQVACADVLVAVGKGQIETALRLAQEAKKAKRRWNTPEGQRLFADMEDILAKAKSD